MKRMLIAILLLMTVGAAVNAQSTELNGPVRSVEEWVYKTELRFGEIVEVLESHTATTYNTAGNVLEEVEYSPSGGILGRTVNKYSGPCQAETVHYTSTGSIEDQTLKECDSAGRGIRGDTYDKDGQFISRFTTEYEGNLTRERFYDATGKLTTAMDVETDGRGHITRMVAYDEDTGEPSSVIEYENADDGKPLRTLMYGENGDLAGEFRYEYTHDIDGMDDVTTTTLYVAGIPFKSTTEGLVTTFDTHGNWIEKRTYKQEEKFGKSQWTLTKVEKRVIEYH